MANLNPYTRPESGWLYESGQFRESSDEPWQFYVDSANGHQVYNATPDQLHKALIENVDTDYFPEDDNDGKECDRFISELVTSYLEACKDNQSTVSQ